MQISHAFIRVKDVENVPSFSLAIRFITAMKPLAEIIFFGNQADGNGHILALVFGFDIEQVHFRCRIGKPVSRRIRILHSM